MQAQGPPHPGTGAPNEPSCPARRVVNASGLCLFSAAGGTMRANAILATLAVLSAPGFAFAQTPLWPIHYARKK